MSIDSRLSSLALDFSPLLSELRRNEEVFIEKPCEYGDFSQFLKAQASSAVSVWDEKASVFLEEIRNDCIALGLPAVTVSLSRARNSIINECEKLISRAAQNLFYAGKERSFQGDGFLLCSNSFSVPILDSGVRNVLNPSVCGVGFEQGLEAWNDAYRDFLILRSSWDDQVRENLGHGEALWAKAIEDLENARDSWFSEINDTVFFGREGFSREAEEIRNSYVASQEALLELAEKANRGFLDTLNEIKSAYAEGARIAEEAGDMLSRIKSQTWGNPESEAFWLEAKTKGESLREHALSMLEDLEESFFADHPLRGSSELLGRIQFIIDAAGDSPGYADTMGTASILFDSLSAFLENPVKLAEIEDYMALKTSEQLAREKADYAGNLTAGYRKLMSQKEQREFELQNKLISGFSDIFLCPYQEVAEYLSWEDLSSAAVSDEELLPLQAGLWLGTVSEDQDSRNL